MKFWRWGGKIWRLKKLTPFSNHREVGVIQAIATETSTGRSDFSRNNEETALLSNNYRLNESPTAITQLSVSSWRVGYGKSTAQWCSAKL